MSILYIKAMYRIKSYTLLGFAAFSLLVFIGCSSQKSVNGLSIEHINIDKYYNVDIPDSLKSPLFEGEGYSLHNTAKIVWPTSIDGTTPTDLQKEILRIAFNDTISENLDQSIKNFEKTGYGLEAEQLSNFVETDSTHANIGEILQSISVKLEQADDKLYTFGIFIQNNFPSAAHGIYSYWHATYDRLEKKVVTLESLFSDKDKLRLLLENQRKKDLKKTGRSYDEYMIEEFPISESFCIEGSNISFTYQPYEIASYAEGIQTVSLSFYEMNEAGVLTQYAKKLLADIF